MWAKWQRSLFVLSYWVLFSIYLVLCKQYTNTSTHIGCNIIHTFTPTYIKQSHAIGMVFLYMENQSFIPIYSILNLHMQSRTPAVSRKVRKYTKETTCLLHLNVNFPGSFFLACLNLAEVWVNLKSLTPRFNTFSILFKFRCSGSEVYISYPGSVAQGLRYEKKETSLGITFSHQEKHKVKHL